MDTDRRRLEAAATTYTHLKGLYGIPAGLLGVLCALGNWHWGPFRHDLVFLGAALLIGASALPIARHYRDTYGRVTLTARQERRAAATAALTVPIVFGGSLLLRSRASWSLDLPVNPVAASLGIVLLATYAATVGLRRHQVVICGALLVAGIVPLWTGSDPSNVGLLMAGAAIMATGLLDHRLLAATLGPPRTEVSRVGDGDAPA